MLLAESLRVAHQAGALRTKDLARVTVDTTVQPKNVTFPIDSKLNYAAIKGLNRLAKKYGIKLRQSYLRLSKRAALMAGRYAHAKQFRRHKRELRFLRTKLGRLVRDIGRKIKGKEALEKVFAAPLAAARQIQSQNQHQRGWKLYSFHAPETECIGKGKATNAILTAAGHNLRLVLRWLSRLLRFILQAVLAGLHTGPQPNGAY